ncbi:MAG: hypothetical protein R2729_19515 [Bryobacteraceae bacterium]
MLLRVQWDGSHLPFEGERKIPVRTIPEGARIEGARVKVTPVDPGSSFLERIDLTVPRPAWGANKVVGPNFVEVDFRARRTLAAVGGSNLNGPFLQIDPGGTYVEINDQGAIAGPGQPRFTLPSAAGGVLPSFVAARFKFTSAGLAPVPDLSRVDIRSVPENVSLRIGDEPVFHTFLGTMTGVEESIDFASLLNEFLQAEEAQNGFFDFSLVVHSDTIARLIVEAEFDIEIEHKALEEGVGESVLGFEFDAIPAGAASSFRFDLPAESQAVAGRSAIRFQGAFDDTRIALGPLAPDLTGGAVELHPAAGRAQAQAQPFTPSANLNITGIDLLLAPKPERAEVQVDIRRDLGGKPGLDSLFAAPLKVTLQREPARSPRWVTVALEKELSLLGGVPLWIVVQATLDESAWSVTSSAETGPGLQTTRDGALSWRAAHAAGTPPLEALFRLRHKPAAFTMPIHVFVGEGPARKEVSLARYEPLGRVDFVLDTEEYAAAINQTIAQSPAVACLPVEHLANGALENWFRTGTAPQPPRTTPTTANGSDPFRALQAVLSPTGDVAYLVSFTGRRPVIRRMDPFCGELIDTVTLSAAPGEGVLAPAVAAGTSGRRLFIAAGNRIWAVDTESMDEIGAVSFGDGTIAVAAAAAAGRVHLLAASLTGTAPQSQIVTIAENDLETAATSGTQPPLSPSAAPSDARSIAVSQDGQTIALLAPIGDVDAGRLDVVQASGAVTSIPLAFSPRGLALSADGKTAFVGAASDSNLRAVAIASRTVAAGPTVGVRPAVISMAALDGHRLAALEFSPFDPNGNTAPPRLAVVDFGTPVPEAWTITAGAFLPACLPAPFHVVGVLGGQNTGKQLTPMSSVSQVVPASAGCDYEFSFHAVATADGAFGEVIWRGSDCASPLTTRVPIEVRGTSFQRAADAVAPVLHRVRVKSPAGVTHAEVRFRVTEGVRAAVDLISLRPVDGPLTNADFLQPGEGSVPEGWTLVPEGAPGFSATARGIENNGTDPLLLTQEIQFEPGTAFRLEIAGSAKGDAGVIAAVHWLNADAQPVEVTLEGTGTVAAAGTSPATAARTEVSLLIPGGSGVQLDRFAVRTGLTAGVPVEVFAETRGELTVSRFQIVTTDAPPRPLPVPAGGLCPPTKPGAEDGEECGYCPCCGSEEAAAPAPTATVCIQCGVTLPGTAGVRVAARRIAPLPRLVTASRVAASTRSTSRVAVAAFSSLNGGAASPTPAPALGEVRDHILSVSREESARMAAAGIRTVAALAATDDETVARLLPSQSLARARMLIGLAKKHAGG